MSFRVLLVRLKRPFEQRGTAALPVSASLMSLHADARARWEALPAATLLTSWPHTRATPKCPTATLRMKVESPSRLGLESFPPV